MNGVALSGRQSHTIRLWHSIRELFTQLLCDDLFINRSIALVNRLMDAEQILV